MAKWVSLEDNNFQNMATARRRFSFQGSDAQYIDFLEQRLLSFIETNAVPFQLDSHCTSHNHQPNARSARLQNSDETNELSIIHYNPQGTTKNPTKPPRSRIHIDNLLNTIPDSARWTQWRKHKGFHTVEQNRYVISSLTSTEAIELDKLPTLRSKMAGIDIPESVCEWVRTSYPYASQNLALEEKCKIATKLFALRQIILVSTCVVMLSVGISGKVVDSIIQTCVKATEPRQLEKYRHAARWMNKCIQHLSAEG